MLTTSDFTTGDKVYFGRGNGEKTLGEVVKVNRAKLKVKQLEARGTMRSYRIGTIWTVPPTLCSKVAGSGTVSTPAKVSRPTTPREILAAKGIKTGDLVEFTFRNGEGTLTGTLVRINAKRVTIENVSGSKYPRGVYCNPGSILRKVGTAPAAAPAPKLALKVGQGVVFWGYDFKSKGETDVTGVITKLNQSKGTYEVFGGGYGRTLEMAPAKILGSIVRDEADIMSAFNSVYGSLSPENLWCDGEASRSHVRTKSAQLNRALKALSKEQGREVSESESWAWRKNRRSA